MIYVLNFEDNQGYAIVSGDTRTTAPIFMITEEGNLDPEVGVNCPGTALFLANMEEVYKQETAATASSYPSFTLYTPWKHWYNGRQTYLKWDQWEPFNDYVPGLAGCTAIAFIQYLAWNQHPITWRGHTYNWTAMCKHHYKSLTDYSPAYGLLARIVEQVGRPEYLNTTYGSEESTADPKNIPKTLRSMGYTNGGQAGNYNIDVVWNNLTSGKPVIAWGYGVITQKKVLGIAISTSYSKGHTWLIERTMMRERTATPYVNGVEKPSYVESHWLVYCNMGWEGKSNGYYYSGAFDATKTVVPDGSVSTNPNHNFQYIVQMIYNMQK